MDSCFIIVNRQTIRSVNLDSYTERDFNNYTSAACTALFLP